MKKALFLALTAVCVGAFAQPVWAQDQEAALFGGYSFLRLEQDGTENQDLHGAELDYTYFLDRRFGFTVSAMGSWGSLDAPPNIFTVSSFDATQFTFLAGPHAVLWRGLTSEAGIRALGGAAWRRLDTPSGISIGDNVEVAWALQANLDFRLSDHLWVRALQPSILWTRFGDQTQTNLRIAVGLVLKAGEILQ